MSIFKESFPKYVKDQLKIREEIIGGGIKGPNGSVFKGTDMGGGKTYMVENRMDKGGMMGAASIAPLDAGAFFAYQQKTCAIRMCSGANITKKGAEEVLGFTDSYIQNTFGSAFSGINKYEDDYLSRRFILAGGVPNVRSPDTSKSVVNTSPSTVMFPDAVILVAPTSPLKKASLPVIPALVLIIQLADTVPKRVI